MTAGADGKITFSAGDVTRFAVWSADGNPLHVDPAFARQTHFGQQVVHGILTVLQSLAAVSERQDRRPATLDIEFRQAVLAGDACRVERGPGGGDLHVSLKKADQLVLDVRGGYEPLRGVDSDIDRPW